MKNLWQKANEAAAYIQKELGDFKPEVALVLGTGLHVISDRIKNPKIIKYEDIPHFHASTNTPEFSILVSGILGGKRVILQKYRLHYYEGYSFDELTLPIRAFGMMGIKNILLTNAAGSINSGYQPNDYMVIKDHINFSGRNPLLGKNFEGFGTRFVGCETLYDKEINKKILPIMRKHARKAGSKVHEGVYMMFSGPTFETPAEIQFGQKIGGDAAGMSTVPEALVAQHMGMTVTGFSLITNWGAGLGPGVVDHKEVCKNAEMMKSISQDIVEDILKEMTPNENKLKEREEYLKELGEIDEFGEKVSGKKRKREDEGDEDEKERITKKRKI